MVADFGLVEQLDFGRRLDWVSFASSGGGYLDGCLDSLESQNYYKWELLVLGI